MRVTFGNLFDKVAPLIKAAIPSLDELKRYIRRCFQELAPQLSTAKSFNDVIDIVQDSCTIINICCLEAIVDRYKVNEAEKHIAEFKKQVDTFCEKVKADICLKQNFKTTSSSHLICESIEFVVEWKAGECTLRHIKGLLSKAFEDMAKSVQVRAVNEGNSIIVTCYAPLRLMDFLLMVVKSKLDLLKEMGVIKLTIGYHIIFDKYKEDKVRNNHFKIIINYYL